MAFKRNLISKWTKVQDNRAKYAAKAAETREQTARIPEMQK